MTFSIINLASVVPYKNNPIRSCEDTVWFYCFDKFPDSMKLSTFVENELNSPQHAITHGISQTLKGIFEVDG